VPNSIAQHGEDVVRKRVGLISLVEQAIEVDGGRSIITVGQEVQRAAIAGPRFPG
jgi:hypothetical protein